MVTPSSARPATSMPVIAPALKASSSPPASEIVAACAVRTLARTETFMPMKPAAPDKKMGRGRGGAPVVATRDILADEAGGPRRDRAVKEADRDQRPEKISQQREDHDAGHRVRLLLAFEMGLRSFGDRRSDLLHA